MFYGQSVNHSEFIIFLHSKTNEILEVEEDQTNPEALKVENREIRHEIFDLLDEVKRLEAQLAEIREEDM